MAEAGQAEEQELFWRSLYLPEQGMFCAAPAELQLGTRLPVRRLPHAAARACMLRLLMYSVEQSCCCHFCGLCSLDFSRAAAMTASNGPAQGFPHAHDHSMR